MALDLGIFLQGAGSSNKVKVTDNDALAQYLKDKITSVDSSVTITERDNGSVETLDLSVAGGSDTNIANTDLTFSGNRTVNQNSLSLSFTNIGGFYIGGNAAIGTEDISLQGSTLIQGQGNTSGTTAFEVENIDGKSLLLISDAGTGYISAGTGTKVIQWNNQEAYWFGRGASMGGTGDTSTHVLIGQETAINGNGHYHTVVGSRSSATKNGTGKTAIGYDNDISSTSNYSTAVGAFNKITSGQGNLFGFSNQSSANGTAIGNHININTANTFTIGYGVSSVSKLNNTVSNSLGLGFSETTPSFLFAKTADSYLNGSGNVSIGSTTANAKLDVAGDIAITDGMTAPTATVGKAKIYVDSADGDLKIIFGDGTVKTITTDT